MTVQEFNELSTQEVSEALGKCCVSSAWINGMMEQIPFVSENELVEKASAIWYSKCKEKDILEAFTGHPKIGDVNSLKKKFANSKDWAENEQASISEANQHIIEELSKYNTLYEKKFGFIFIVSASGKSAAEMLQLIKIRCAHNRSTELNVAMGEQHKITNIRLAKLIPSIKDNADNSSHVTTHVLDTSTGVPGHGMVIKMKIWEEDKWQTIALGITNEDGRITNLLPPGKRLTAGNYLMQFKTDGYYQAQHQEGFYPEVDIQFKVKDKSHYHIPLLLNPYGFTTYRGS